MNKLLVAGALFLASSQAFSGIVTGDTQTVSFGAQGSFTDQAIGVDFDGELTISAFDTALGRLTGVSINVASQINSKASSLNQSLDSAISSYELRLNEDWAVTSDAGNFTFNDRGILVSGIDRDHEINETFIFSDFEQLKIGSITASDLSVFVSDVTFDFDVDVSNNFNNNANSGTGVFQNILATAAWAQVQVTYTYDDSPIVNVPEPTSIALLGLGLAGLAFSRKAKKSA